MKQLPRAVVSVLAGVVAFLAVGVAVTALLDPYVWPSLLLGLPAGIVAGAATVVLTYVGLTYRHERATTGAVAPRTAALLWAAVAAVVAFVVAGGFATAVVVHAAVGLATAMLIVGFPVGLLAAAIAAVVAGYLAMRRTRRRRRFSRPAPR